MSSPTSANHYIFLDHDQTFSASAGAVYNWQGFTFSVDGIYGSGLRDWLRQHGKSPVLHPDSTPVSRRRFVLPKAGAIEVRAAVINLNDRTYQIRNGTGIGVFAAQYGPRRAFFGGNKMGSSFVQPDDRAVRQVKVKTEKVKRRSAGLSGARTTREDLIDE